MKNYKLLLKQKLLSFKNLIRISVIKYPLESLFAFILTLTTLYILYNYLLLNYGQYNFHHQANYFVIIDFFKKELLFVIGLVSYCILKLSVMNTLQYWIKTNNLLVKIEEIFYSYLTIYFLVFKIIILIPLIMLLIILKANIILFSSLILIYSFILLIYIFFTLIIYILLSIKLNNRYLFDISFFISVIIMSKLISSIMAFPNVNKEIFFLFIVFILFLSSILLYIFTTNKELNFNNLISNKKLITTTRSKNFIFNFTSNNYIILVFLETIYNLKLYFNIIIFPVALIILSKNIFRGNFLIDFLVIMASVSTIGTGLHFSYIYIFSVLPIKEHILLLVKAIFSFIFILFILLLLNYGLGIKPNYLYIILLSIFMFCLSYLSKVPIIKDGVENPFFYLYIQLMPLIISYIIFLLNSAIYLIFDFNLDEKIIISFLILLILPLLIFKKTDDKKEFL